MKKTAKLKPYCKKIGSGVTPRGGDGVYIDFGIALIRSQNVYNGVFVNQGLAFIDNDIAQKMKGVTLERNDILLNITGDSVARCCMVLENLLPARVNQHVSIIRTHKEKLDPQFLMYYLISPLMQSRMLSFAGSGGTRKALTKEMIEDFDIPLIEYPTQHKIASILSAYDDLIDINRRRIRLLEEAARLLFSEWFVYFRFPGHEEIKIVDGMPEGWEKGSVKDIAKVKSGYAFDSKDWLDEGNPVIKIGNIIGDGTVNLDDCSYIDQNVASKAKDFVLKKGDLLIAMTGATVGKVGLLSENEKIAYLNQRVGKFIP